MSDQLIHQRNKEKYREHEFEGFSIMPVDNVLKLYSKTIESKFLHYGPVNPSKKQRTIMSFNIPMA